MRPWLIPRHRAGRTSGTNRSGRRLSCGRTASNTANRRLRGEKLEIRTWVSDFSKVTSLRKYQVFRPQDGQVLAVGETDWAFLGLDPYVPRRIPPELAEAFQLVPLDQEP